MSDIKNPKSWKKSCNKSFVTLDLVNFLKYDTKDAGNKIKNRQIRIHENSNILCIQRLSVE